MSTSDLTAQEQAELDALLQPATTAAASAPAPAKPAPVETLTPLDTFNLANAAFVDENYAKALALYSQAIDADDANARFLEKRSAVYIKLSRYTDALIDANSALQLDATLAQAHVRQGTALFHLGDVLRAQAAFQTAVALGDTSESTAAWLGKCPAPASGTVASAAAAVAGSTVMGGGPALAGTGAAGTLGKVKHDWYQTDSHVTLEVLMKGVAPANVSYETTERTLALAVKLPHGASYNLDLDLFGSIIPAESKLSVLKTKIEVRLRKAAAVRWINLEGDPDGASLPPVYMQTPDENVAAKEKQKQAKWSALAQDVEKAEKEEKPEGEAALTHLFKDIYGNANDDTRRAMMKSFQESGGTVLSTNWAEIGAKKTEIKPPAGAEYKKYSEYAIHK